MNLTELVKTAEVFVDAEGNEKVALDRPIWEEIVTLLEAVQYVSVTEFARRVKADPNLVEKLLSSGALPGRQISERWLVAAEALERFARIEQILNDLDAEQPPLSPEEAAEAVSRGREEWTERIWAQNEQMLHLLRTMPDDDKGPEWWDEFEQELRQNRVTFPEREIFLTDQEALDLELAAWDVLSDEALAETEQKLQDPSTIMGKYSFVPTSSEDFARRKQEEIDLEG